VNKKQRRTAADGHGQAARSSSTVRHIVAASTLSPPVRYDQLKLRSVWREPPRK
jgi:hypothetical protein